MNKKSKYAVIASVILVIVFGGWWLFSDSRDNDGWEHNPFKVEQEEPGLLDSWRNWVDRKMSGADNVEKEKSKFGWETKHGESTLVE